MVLLDSCRCSFDELWCCVDDLSMNTARCLDRFYISIQPIVLEILYRCKSSANGRLILGMSGSTS